MDDLDFHTQILSDINSSAEGGLLLLSKGLGVYRILALLIHQRKTIEKTPLYIFLNFEPEEIQTINELLAIFSENIRISSISSEPSHKRTKLYLAGGFYALSPVIIIFDLLQNAISPLLISGVVMRGLEFIRTSLAKEFLITTLIRLESQKTFVLGIIDELEMLLSRSSLVELLKNMLLKKVFLWPACRYEVQKNLTINNQALNPDPESNLPEKDQSKPDEKSSEIKEEKLPQTSEKEENSQFFKENKDLIDKILNEKTYPVRTFEVYLKLSSLMRKIQDSLLRVMEKLRLEVNRLAAKSPTYQTEKHNFSFEDLASLNYRAFYRKLFNLKDLQIKNPVFLENLKDLLNFKRLLQELVICDSCRFLRKIEIFRDGAGNQSVWYLGDEETHKELEKLMKFSRTRVFEIVKVEGNIQGEGKSIFEFRLSQEEFMTVNKVLEIMKPGQKFEKVATLDENSENNDPEKTKHEISSQNNKFINFELKNKVKLNLEVSPKLEILRKTLEKIGEKVKISPLNKGVIWIHAGSEEKAKEISDFLSSCFYRKDLHILNTCRQMLFLLNNPQSKNARFSRILDILKKQIKPSEFTQQNIEDLLLEEKRQNFSLFLDNLKEIEVMACKEENLELYREIFKDFAEKQGLHQNIDFSKILLDKFDDQGNREFQKDSIVPDCEVIVNSLRRTAFRESFLVKFKPKFIILFEPNLTLIREVLVYQKYYGVSEISLYILMFRNTVESAENLEMAKRENRMFERLIKETQNRIETTETARDRIKKLEYLATFPQNSTRIGGLSTNKDKKSIIIIDKREFHHSTLPAKLFYAGFTIIPRFLEKGDYILGEDIAIERKSVTSGDLMESLKTGRLDKQAKRMLETFKKSGLLIEFSEDWKFSFESLSKSSNYQLQKQSSEFLGVDSSTSKYDDDPKQTRSGICFMLSVLVMKYPNFNIFWSKGNDNTAKLFAALKRNQREPDPNKYLPKSEEKEDEIGDLLGVTRKQNMEEGLVIGGNLIGGGVEQLND